ncbi:MAG: uracil-DNA glycosylase family protein [Fulvivirga sp.]
MTFAKKVIDFYKNIEVPTNLPEGVEVLHPFNEREVTSIVNEFYNKYYQDNKDRTFLIGINPGRFGGGATGIPFTDPIRLKEVIGIDNSFDQKAELSSKFIYQMIERLGGPEPFYRNFYFTSVSPLGFVKDGKNLNYYDIKELQNVLEQYIVDHLKEQIAFGSRPIAYSLGKGQNIKYLKWLNKKYELFEDIRPLPHPRWVMQYRLKRLDEFIEEYFKALSQHLNN